MLWDDTVEERVVDFEPLFIKWKVDTNLMKLHDWDVFKDVTVSDTGSLCWNNVLISFTFNDILHTEPLELDALVLYSQSKKVSTQ